MMEILPEKLNPKIIVEAAKSWVGTPYHHQASIKNVGCDCLGLVRGIWREVLGAEPCTTPQYSADWGEVGAHEKMLEVADKYFVKTNAAYPNIADLIFFRWQKNSIIKHVGVSSAPGRFIHAYEKTGVVESPLVNNWARRVAAIYRFPGVSS